MIRRLAHAGATVSVVVTVTVILFVIANLLVQAAYEAAIRTDLIETNPFLRKYGDAVQKAHPDMDRAALNALLRETWGHPAVYDPVVQFKEPAREGAYVNVDAAGFRRGLRQAIWPPQDDRPSVFFFGGSTTFGYNVRDEETLASHFQDLSEAAFSREVQVYNFGRGNYASSAEMLLFLRLLFEGHRPELAVFVDGLNDFQHGGSRDLLQTNDLRRLYDNYDSNDIADQLSRIVAALPIMKAINWLMTTLGLHHPDTGVPAPASDSRPAESEVGRSSADVTLELYGQNRRIVRALSEEFGVKTAFVWQPIPFYRDDLAYHPFRDTVPIWRSPGHVPGYRKVEALHEAQGMGDDFVWCAGIQDGVKEQLYTDSVHYTNLMNRRVAQCILDGLPDGIKQTLRAQVPTG